MCLKTRDKNQIKKKKKKKINSYLIKEQKEKKTIKTFGSDGGWRFGHKECLA